MSELTLEAFTSVTNNLNAAISNLNDELKTMKTDIGELKAMRADIGELKFQLNAITSTPVPYSRERYSPQPVWSNSVSGARHK